MDAMEAMEMDGEYARALFLITILQDTVPGSNRVSVSFKLFANYMFDYLITFILKDLQYKLLMIH